MLARICIWCDSHTNDGPPKTLAFVEDAANRNATAAAIDELKALETALLERATRATALKILAAVVTKLVAPKQAASVAQWFATVS